MSRGRLIRPLVATIAPLDTVAIEAAGDYDDDFNEVVKKDNVGDDGIGETQRKEGTAFTLKVQQESDLQEMQRITGTGDIPDTAVGLVAHMKELETKGMVAADGRVTPKRGDRLVKLATKMGVDVMTFDRTPVYATHVKRIDGWLGHKSNLLFMQFDDREQGVP